MRPWLLTIGPLGLLVVAALTTRPAQAQYFLQVQEAQAVPAAAPAAADDIDDAQLEPFLAQFRPILKVELSLANRVCEFTDKQRGEAINESKVWLKEYARNYMKRQGHAQRIGLRAFVAGPRSNVENNPQIAIADGVSAVVKKIVSPEKFAEYETELTHRREFQQQVVVDGLVALIDERLYLSARQRTALAKSLADKWDDSWAPSMASLMHMGNYLPQIPNELVTPHLNPEQKTVWQGIQKVNFSSANWGQNHWLGAAQPIDDIDLNGGE